MRLYRFLLIAFALFCVCAILQGGEDGVWLGGMLVRDGAQAQATPIPQPRVLPLAPCLAACGVPQAPPLRLMRQAPDDRFAPCAKPAVCRARVDTDANGNRIVCASFLKSMARALALGDLPG